MQINSVQINSDLQKTINNTASELRCSPYDNYQPAYVSASASILKYPGVIGAILDNMQKNGAVLIKNLPVGSELPNTPNQTDFNHRVKASYSSETSLLAIASILGDLKNYAYEKDGAYIHNIYPVKQLGGSASNHGFHNELEFHNEIAFDPNRPDYILILCLRQDPGKQAATRVASIENAVAQLPEKYRKLLFEKTFKVLAPESFTKTKKYVTLPLMSIENGVMKSAFNFNCGTIISPTKEAETALQLLKEIVHETSVDIKLEPGNALIINNRRLVHARTSYDTVDDINNRWLQRVYIKEN